MRALRIACVLVGCLTSGCASVPVTSELYDAGVTYYLPKALVTVVVRQVTEISTKRTWYELGDPTSTDPANGKSVGEFKYNIVPDPQHRYVLKYHPSPLSDDRLCISRGPNGLLTDVQFASDDRTPEVIFNVTRFLAGLLGPGPAPTSFITPSDQNKYVVNTYASEIDPFSKEDVDAFNLGIQRTFANPHLKIDASRMKRMLLPYQKHLAAFCGDTEDVNGPCPYEVLAKHCSPGHICYRTLVKLPIDLRDGSRLAGVAHAYVVNPYDIGFIDITRAPLVHKITKLRFDRGALIAAIVRKPSELEEASLLPLNVVNAILSVPAGFVRRTFSRQDQVELINEVTKLNNAVSELQKSQQALLLGAAGAPALDQTKYELNCHAPPRGSDFNVVQDP